MRIEFKKYISKIVNFSVVLYKKCKEKLLTFYKLICRHARASIATNKTTRKCRKKLLYLVFVENQTQVENFTLHSEDTEIKNSSIEILIANKTRASEHYSWHHTQSKSILFIHSKIDEEALRSLLECIKHHRPYQPINGIIINEEIAYLTQSASNESKTHRKFMLANVSILSKTLKISLPIYFVISDINKLEGFSLLAKGIKSKSTEIIGLQLSLTQDIATLKKELKDKFDQLVTLFKKITNEALLKHESKEENKKIALFSHQLLAIKENLLTSISNMVIDKNQTSLIRGIYFITTNNEATKNLTSPFEFSTHNIFTKTILPEAKLLGHSKMAKRVKRIKNKMILMMPIIAFIVGTLFLYNSYADSQHRLQRASNWLRTFKSKVKYYQHPHNDISSTLLTLSPLQKTARLLEHGSHFFISNSIIYKKFTVFLQRTAQTFLLPRVANLLANEVSSTENQPERLYQALKGYLAFSEIDPTPAYSIITPTLAKWQSSKELDQTHFTSAKYFLLEASKQPLPAFPLNEHLIQTSKHIVEKISVFDRAYQLLSSMASNNNINEINLQSVAGNQSKTIFNLEQTTATIPAFYTLDGYKKIFQSKLHDIIKLVIDDNNALGINNDSIESGNLSELKKKLVDQYKKQYLKTWKGQYLQIQIRHIKTWRELQSLLADSSRKNSPVIKLLSTYLHNNKPFLDKKEREQLASYIDRHSHEQKSLLKTIQNVNQLFNQIEYSDNKLKALNQAMISFINRDENNALYQLFQLTFTTPKPLSRWLTELTEQCWLTLNQQFIQALDKKWHEQVIVFYQKYLKGRYPLDFHGSKSINYQKFNQFFKADGILSSFVKQYLAKYIRIGSSNWYSKKMANYQVLLSQTLLNSLQQAHTISKHYLANDETPQIELAITPYYLDSRIISADLTLNKSQLIYRHGPEQTVNISWPYSDNDKISTLSLLDQDKQYYQQQANGDWSLFKLFRKGKLYHWHGKSYLAFHFGSYVVRYQIKTESTLKTLNLAYFKHFHLPSHTGTLPGETHE